jgi:hypothetical protein
MVVATKQEQLCVKAAAVQITKEFFGFSNKMDFYKVLKDALNVNKALQRFLKTCFMKNFTMKQILSTLLESDAKSSISSL